MSIMVATGKGATAGVLFKNAEAIELLQDVDTLVVDKTGTLTEGKPRLVSVKALEGFDEESVLRLAATIERSSEHPLASAIVAGAHERGLALGATSEFDSVTGKGVVGSVEGQEVAVGNAALLSGMGVAVGPMEDELRTMRSQGQTAMLVAVGRRFAGVVGVADP